MKTSSSSAAAYIPPPGIIEVVSNNWKDDYLTKLAEYEDLGVFEYMIVDYAAFGGIRFIGSPKQATITIYQLEDGEYLPPKVVMVYTRWVMPSAPSCSNPHAIQSNS